MSIDHEKKSIDDTSIVTPSKKTDEQVRWMSGEKSCGERLNLMKKIVVRIEQGRKVFR